MITVRLQFTQQLTDEDVITAIETINYWTANRAMTQGDEPTLEWSSNQDAVHVTADFESGNCYRRHGEISPDWLKPIDEKKRRGYDLTSMLNCGKVQKSGHVFPSLRYALVSDVRVVS